MLNAMRRDRGAGLELGTSLKALTAGLVLFAGTAVWAQDAQPAQPAEQPAATPAPAQPVRPFSEPAAAPGMQIKREAPPLKAEPNIIDLKYVQPGTKTDGVTTLTNTGTEAVTISKVTTSCHCTIPTDLSGKVLQPGETVELGATLEAGKYPGAQQRQVRVFAEGYAVPMQVYVVAQVSYGVAANPVFVDAFQKKAGEIVFESVDGKPFKIICLDGRAPTAADFKEFDPAKDEPRNRYVYVYDLTQTPDDQLKPWFVVATDHPTAPLIDLRVINPTLIPKMTGAEPWRMTDDRVLLGAIKQGERVEFTATLTRNNQYNDDKLPTISVDDPNVEVELVSAVLEGDSNMVCKVALTAKSSGENCLIRPRVTFTWLDHSQPMDVFARVDGGGSVN